MIESTVARLVTTAEIAEYMPLVHRIVGRMLRRLPRNVLRDDLVAAGTVGLLDALRRQTGRGVEFTWYARVRIRGAVIDELRAQDWLSRRARQKQRSEEGSSAFGVIAFEDLPEAHREMEDKKTANPEWAACARSQADVLARAVRRLPVRERTIINAHYFGGEQLSAIARELGVSGPRVSQLHARAVDRLRGFLATEPAETVTELNLVA